MRKLIITIPIGEHQETIETLYAIGTMMKISGNQIFVDCVNGCLPEALTEIDRCFAIELTADKPHPNNRFEADVVSVAEDFTNRPVEIQSPNFDIPQLEVMG